MILRYTEPGDLVVDAFVGGGTTLIEAWLLGRRSVGLDISRLAINTARARLAELKAEAEAQGWEEACLELKPMVLEDSALRLTSALANAGVGAAEVRLICAHPPYLDSLEYTRTHPDDLATIGDARVFYDRLQEFAVQARECLSSAGTCAVLIGDVRKEGHVEPLGLGALGVFLGQGFLLENVVIKTQHRDRSSEFYFGKDDRSLLMAHEYLLILRKGPERPSGSPAAVRARQEKSGQPCDS